MFDIHISYLPGKKMRAGGGGTGRGGMGRSRPGGAGGRMGRSPGRRMEVWTRSLDIDTFWDSGLVQNFVGVQVQAVQAHHRCAIRRWSCTLGASSSCLGPGPSSVGPRL